jgi:hypothetical protein
MRVWTLRVCSHEAMQLWPPGRERLWVTEQGCYDQESTGFPGGAEFETPGMAEFEKMMQGEGMSEADTKEFERIMEGYHDLIESGHREIYRLEAATKR